MEEIEAAVSVLAVLVLPLVGVGPMVMRVLSQRVFGALVLSCAALVLILTKAPWAAGLALCAGAGVLLMHRRALRRAPAYTDERDSRSR